MKGCRRCWALVQSSSGKCPLCKGELEDAKRWKGSAPGKVKVWIPKDQAA